MCKSEPSIKKREKERSQLLFLKKVRFVFSQERKNLVG